jgi:hypothetical protein
MRFFYWTMGVLIVGTLLPSVVFFTLYLLTGNDAHGSRAKTWWAFTRLFALSGFNLLIWGHVIVGLWQIWFR